MLENQEKTMETSMCDSMNEMDATMKNVGITPEKISEMIVDEEQNTNDEPKTKEQQFMDYLSDEINHLEDDYATNVYKLGQADLKDDEISEQLSIKRECKMLKMKMDLMTDIMNEFESLFMAA
ncbi:MAG: hypothetical protein IJ681_06135 [Bacteroidales bacterium]|jgi:hypothetical protein|nr:hypothetical protein [bacterium]MBO6273490.1 hypothetical protein [bacterium]MBR1626706.1 hypothetical protein [Bacteroidales bacterium]